MILSVTDDFKILGEKWLRNKLSRRFWKSTKIWTRQKLRFCSVSKQFSAYRKLRRDAGGEEKMKIILLIALTVGLNVCFSTAKIANLGAEFVLKKNETAMLKDTDLHLKMRGNGQSQRESGGDVVFCKFEIKSKNKIEEQTLNVGETARFENFNIKLQSVNTTADPKLNDPWSATSCEFIVTKK